MGGVAASITHPIDITKVHLQASGDKGMATVAPEYCPHRGSAGAVRWHMGDAHASDESFGALLLGVRRE